MSGPQLPSVLKRVAQCGGGVATYPSNIDIATGLPSADRVLVGDGRVEWQVLCTADAIFEGALGAWPW